MATGTEIVVSPHYRLTLPGGTEVYATQEECRQLYFILSNPKYVETPPPGARLLRDLMDLPGRLTAEQIVKKAARRKH